jgi:hypothetical protein
VIRFLLLALALTACTCGPVIPPVDPDPPEPTPVDAGADVAPVPDSGADDCELAYQKLKALQCISETGRALWVSPVDGKTPFSETCRAGYSKGVNYHPECLKQITNCDQRNEAAKGIWCGGEP